MLLAFYFCSFSINEYNNIMNVVGAVELLLTFNGRTFFFIFFFLGNVCRRHVIIRLRLTNDIIEVRKKPYIDC
jgi:hypothetical protein